MNKRNQYNPEFKSKVVLEVLREEFTVNEIAAKYELSPVMVSRWKAEFLEKVPKVFKRGASSTEKELETEKERVAQLERKIGQLTYEVDWLKKNLKNSTSENVRKELVEKNNPQICLKRQAELLTVNRTSLYRKPPSRKISDLDLYIMRLIDELHTADPSWGYRTITSCLQKQYGLLINHKKVRRLMWIMGIYAIYPKPNLSKLYHAQYIKPYLLRNVAITRANQVWGVDITYVRMRKGFMYLFVVIDWYSRYIVDYELSSTLEKEFVIHCLKRALARQKPEIINSDQGGHFTCPAYIELLSLWMGKGAAGIMPVQNDSFVV